MTRATVTSIPAVDVADIHRYVEIWYSYREP